MRSATAPTPWRPICSEGALMANPPDPHVPTKRRKPLIAVLVAAIVILAGVGVVFANRPGVGMGGSVSGPAQGQR